MPLKYTDLKVGDALLKHSAGSKSNVVIKTGQAIFSHNRTGGTADIVRAFQGASQTFQLKFVPIDADYRDISRKEMQAKLNKSADWSHPGGSSDN
jgi:hypothetical protein